MSIAAHFICASSCRGGRSSWGWISESLRRSLVISVDLLRNSRLVIAKRPRASYGIWVNTLNQTSDAWSKTLIPAVELDASVRRRLDLGCRDRSDEDFSFSIIAEGVCVCGGDEGAQHRAMDMLKGDGYSGFVLVGMDLPIWLRF